MKYQIIDNANSYTLEDSVHNVTINQYQFTPNPYTWNNKEIINEIDNLKRDISELNDEILRQEKLIGETKKSKNESQQYLQTDIETFTNGKCKRPPFHKPPEPLFDTKEKASHHALAYCSISFGCKVGVELAKGKLKTAPKIFLASQACTLLVSAYQDEDILLDETMFNLLDTVSYSGCNSESDDIFSGIIKGGSCVMSGAIKLMRVEQYLTCIDYKTQEFYNTFLDWKDEPKNRQKACEQHLKNVDNTPEILKEFQQNILSLRENIKTKTKQQQQLKNKLQEVLSLRDLQSQMIKQLQH